MSGFRVEGGLDRGRAFQFTFDGRPVQAYPGESIAAALMAAGQRATRTTVKMEAPRGLYCGMGVCWECMVVVNGKAATRACMTEARPGMKVETQRGLGPADPTSDLGAAS